MRRVSTETFARGARSIGYVDARIASLGLSRGYADQQEYNRVIDLLRDEIGADHLENLLADGAAMTNGAAIEYALSIERQAD